MPAALDCTMIEQWQTLPDDELSEDQRSEVERHLETCVVCQERLDRDELCEDVTRTVLRQVGDPTLGPLDPTLVHIMERLCEGKSSLRTRAEAEPDLHFLRPSDRPDTLGRLGEYEVLEVLGQGGMGLVLKAVDTALSRYVAIKVLAPVLAGSATARQRFTREAQAAAAISHDHIVVVHGVRETDDGLPYLVMEYVPGESLQERIDRSGPLELIDIVRIGLQSVSGLAAAHAQGLIHRDIKPANLLLESGLARVTITDFGLARAVDDVQLTQTGFVAGTPEYMSPEQARGDAVDHRSDLFSLGSVLYAMATGLPPFQGSTALAVLRRVNDESAAPVRALNPNVPVWLETLIERLMDKSPDRRLPSAAEVAALLEGYLAHLRQPATSPLPAIPPSRGGPTRRDRKSRRTIYWRWLPRLIMPALVLLTGLTFIAWHFAVGGALPGRADEYQEYFCSLKAGADLEGLIVVGAESEKYVHFEPEGLRIKLPLGHVGTRPSVGLMITQPVQGDFEITVRYEILDEAGQLDPKQPFVTPLNRFTLDAGVNRALDTVATLSWQRDSKVGPQINAWVDMRKEAGGKEQKSGRRFAAKAMTGQFRLVRVGDVIAHFVVEGPGDTFLLVNQAHFTPADLENIFLIAATRSAQAKIDVRLTDLRIRTKPPSGAATTAAPAATELQPAGGRFYLTVVLTLLVTLTLSVGAWLLVARRRCRRTATAFAPAESTSVEPVMFPCPSCDKKLKARAELIGKKIKCPGCGQAAIVPAWAPTPAPPTPVVRKNKGWFWLGAAPVFPWAILLGGWWWWWFSGSERPSLLDVTLGNTPVAHVEEAGFYSQEHDKDGAFRWTDGHARLVIPLDKDTPPQVLAMNLFDFRPPGKPCRLQILVNHKECFNDIVSNRKWQKTFDLTGIDLGKTLVLEIISDTFVPQGAKNGGASNDARQLGVQVRSVRLLSHRNE